MEIKKFRMNLLTRKKAVYLIILLLIIAAALIVVFQQSGKKTEGILSPLGSLKQISSPTPKPLEKYEFEKLKARRGRASEIILEKELSRNSAFASSIFSYQSDARRITGLLNLPVSDKKMPVIIMIRGYVEQENYSIGVGTKRAGEFFAKNGFITLAPDFLGYGESDMPPNDIWEERFLRLTSVLDLLASVKNLTQADHDKIGIWGHSNGGMIVLSILAITGKDYPTTLWAPVAKYFPYDIFYYMDEFDDKGRLLRKNLAEFEKDYDTDKYSYDQYLDNIKAPIQLHQGKADPYIPLSWSDNLVKNLKEKDKEITYYLYANADHNLNPDWSRVTARDLVFFNKKFK